MMKKSGGFLNPRAEMWERSALNAMSVQCVDGLEVYEP